MKLAKRASFCHKIERGEQGEITAGKSLDECRRLLTRSIKIRLFCYQGKDSRFQCQIERGE